jgi:hypothetical protein
MIGDRNFDVRFTKVIFWIGLLVYAVSWFLPAVGPNTVMSDNSTDLWS